MDYKNVKLVVTDMDGTLLHSDYSLNPEFFDIYEELKKLNIKFAVASGRQYDSLVESFSTIKNEIYFIAENGGNVIFKNSPLFIHQIHQDICNEVINICRKLPNTYTILCGLKGAYVEKSNPVFIKHIIPYYPKNNSVSDLTLPIDDKIVKIAIYNSVNSETQVYPHMKIFEENYQVKISGTYWLDISTQNSNKGFALKEVQKIIGISKEDTMVFGDYLNDLEMMHEGYFSFAMKNAHPLLKEAARFETSSNDNDGVLKILKEVIIQNKKYV